MRIEEKFGIFQEAIFINCDQYELINIEKETSSLKLFKISKKSKQSIFNEMIDEIILDNVDWYDLGKISLM